MIDNDNTVVKMARRSWLLVYAAVLGLAFFPQTMSGAQLLVEPESFQNTGGWTVDTEFIHIMGSPYLLAHGLGKPVEDATTTVTFPQTGTYKVFVRTKDWVARWNAPGKPGQFQLLVNGSPLKETFGTRFAEWMWHNGGVVEITNTQVRLTLHDLTGFDGRCDAILFTTDMSIMPPNDSSPSATWRQGAPGFTAEPRDGGTYDLVVVGGGYGGMCAALSAARMGCKVALIQDRPVLGGNGSAEIRVWPQGLTRRGLYPRVGEMVEELANKPRQSPGSDEEFDDSKREAILKGEKNLTLFLNQYVFEVQTNGSRIQSVVAMETRTGVRTRFKATLFADGTGHGVIGYLAGADHTTKDKQHMGMSNMWRWENADSPQSFPLTPWALQLKMDDFPYPRRFSGEWFWESGFDFDPIQDLEAIRDWNLRAVFGAFNAMKNGDGKEQHPNARLTWVAAIGGTRESRQILGDVILNSDDIVSKKAFPDGCVPTTWDIDLHYPQEKYTNATPANPFISKAVFGKGVDKKEGFPVPYRCFYSRNVKNLFVVGRCISVTHEALGTIRVMKTGGMMGEVAGKAASVCIKNKAMPGDIYPSYWDEMKELLNLPGKARRETVNSPTVIPKEVLPLPGRAAIARVEADNKEGTIIDDSQAWVEGSWQAGAGVPGFIGDGYLYHSPGQSNSVSFLFEVTRAGNYEVRTAYQTHANRASNARVILIHAKGTNTFHINQKQALPETKNQAVLGIFPFTPGVTNRVIVDAADADGLVGADAVIVTPK